MKPSWTTNLFLLAGLACLGGVGYFASSLARPGLPAIDVPEVFALGEVPASENVTLAVPVRNVGRAPLVIRKVMPCCGWKAKVAETTIAPGAETTMEVSFSSTGGVGQLIERKIIIGSNDPSRPLVKVAFRGHTPYGVIALPKSVSLGDIKSGERREEQLLIVTPGHSERFGILKVSSSG